MLTEDNIQIVLTQLTEVVRCNNCGTTVRFGVYDCPHCGSDLEDVLRDWAKRLLDLLEAKI